MSAEETVRLLLDYLEPRIDLGHLRRVARLHREALSFRPVERLPLVCYVRYEGSGPALYPYAEAFSDPAKMFVNELLAGFTSIYHCVDLRFDTPLCLRPNFGVGIVASMFGAATRLLDDSMPWVVPLPDLNAIRSLLDQPLPDLHEGLGQRVLNQYAYYRETLADHPACAAAFQLILPDLQGPFSTAELLWGPGVYMAFYDCPDLLAALLGRITDMTLAAYCAFRGEVREDVGEGYQYQHAAGQKGQLLVRNDSAINLSARQYREIVQPHDNRLAVELGGIGIHFCGKGSHQIDNWLALAGMECFDVGQPEQMDLDWLFLKASAARVALTRLELPDNEPRTPQVLSRFSTGVSLLYKADSVGDAKRVWRIYYEGD